MHQHDRHHIPARRRATPGRIAALVAAVALVASACGSDETAGPMDGLPFTTEPPSTTVVTTTTVPDTTVPPPTTDPGSDPDDGAPRAGPLFGSGADAASGDPAHETCLETEDCEGGDVLPPPSTISFEARPEYAAFCTLLADIEQRTAPEPGTEVTTLDAWFAELAPVVPDDLAEPFGVLDGFVDQLVALGGDDDTEGLMAAAVERIEGGEHALDAAAERLGRVTDAECHGRTSG